jgi:hypothetical protein
MSQTYYASNQFLDYVYGVVSFTPPTTYYVGLSTTVISNSGTGATEPSGGAYARVAVTNNKTNFSTASSGALSNATAVTFTESSASWGTITYIFLADALTGGNIWYFEALPSSKIVQSQTTVLFSVGAITFAQTN